MPPPAESRPANPVVTIAVIVLAALSWGAVLFQLVFIVPYFERRFAEFRLRLPSATEMVIALSRPCSEYPYLVPVVFVLGVVAIAVPTWLIRHRLRTRGLGVVWCVAMLVVPLLAVLVVWYSCYLPYTKLLEALEGR
jgi:hypothetical protein